MAAMTISQPSSGSVAVNAPVATGMATMRDPRLDFYRGLAMFIILIAHTPGNFLTLWIPARWGFSDATEIFVFCSGMASAIAFGKVFANRGWFLGTARVGFRIWQVYWSHIGLFFAVAMTMAVLDGTGLYEKSYIGSLNLTHFFDRTHQQLIGLLTLTYVPNYFDILPMYLVILMMLPVVAGLGRVHPGLAIGFIALVWIFAQRSLLGPLGLIDWHLGPPAEPWSDRKWFFNPFGWQLAFFTGFALMRGWIPRPPSNWVMVAVAVGIVLANIPFSNIGMRELGFDWARDIRIANRGLINKSDFGILRYVHFLALAYLGWFIAGDQGRNLMARGTGLLSAIWQVLLTLIVKVGQQSLAVFIFSMWLARMIGFALDNIGRSTGTVLAGNLMGFVAIIAMAYLAAWFKSQPWREKRA